jgi:hypothetical protein
MAVGVSITQLRCCRVCCSLQVRAAGRVARCACLPHKFIVDVFRVVAIVVIVVMAIAACPFADSPEWHLLAHRSLGMRQDAEGRTIGRAARWS